jgi:ribose transport system permease protein
MSHAVRWSAATRAGRALPLVAWLDLAALAAFAAATPAFATVSNLQNVLVSCLPLLLVATGQTLVLVTAGIDLSAPAVVGLTSIAGAAVMSADAGWLAGSPAAAPAGLAAMLAAGASVGALNGAAIAWLRMPAFMVTLTTGMFASGLAVWTTRAIAGTETIYGLPASFLAVGQGIVAAGVLALVGTVAADVLLERTLAGRWLRAVGHSPRAARVAGVPVERVTLGAYLLSGVFAALASILLTARLETAAPTHGRQFLLDVIGAAVIGGTSLAGGVGRVRWTVLGVFFLAVASNGLTLLDLSEFTITIVKGLVIVAAALLDAWRRGRAAGQA